MRYGRGWVLFLIWRVLLFSSRARTGLPGLASLSTNQASAAASNANYSNLVWVGTSEVIARYWTLSAAAASALAGRIFRPVARLQSLIAGGEKMWARIVLNYDNGAALESVYSGEYVQVPIDKLMLSFPPLQLPPWQVLNVTSQAISIGINVYEEGGGSNTINLDELFLIPLDSSLHLIPIITSFPNTGLSYDSWNGSDAGRCAVNAESPAGRSWAAAVPWKGAAAGFRFPGGEHLGYHA